MATNEGRVTKRTRTGCNTCRQRRVKCDDKALLCGPCSRIGLECTWRDEVPAQRLRFNRNRTPTACNKCRVNKRKCSRSRPSCEACQLHGLQCDYATELVGNSVPIREPVEDVGAGESTLASQHDLSLAIDFYFSQVYPIRCNAVIHKPTLLREFNNKSIPRLLSLALRVVACQASNTGNSQNALERELRSSLMFETDAPSTITLVALLLLLHYDLERGVGGGSLGVWTLSSMYIRMAYGLRLNDDSAYSSLPWARQEIRRRLMWAGYCWDKWTAGGASIYTLCQGQSMQLQLPCNDRSFNLEIPCVTPRLVLGNGYESGDHHTSIFPQDMVSYQGGSMMGFYISLAALREAVLRHTREIKPNDPHPWAINSSFDKCLSDLIKWKLLLPQEMELTPATIYARHSTDQLSSLVFLHAWHAQCLCDLYRITLPGSREALDDVTLSLSPPGWVESAQLECFKAAQSFLEVVESVQGLVPEYIHRLDIYMAMFAYEGVQIQLVYIFKVLPDHSEIRDRTFAEAIPKISAIYQLLMRDSTASPAVDRTARMLKELMIRYGVVCDASWDVGIEPSAPPSPRGGPILSNYHPLSRSRRYAEESEDEGRVPVSSMRDTVHRGPYQQDIAESPFTLPSEFLDPVWSIGGLPVFDFGMGGVDEFDDGG